MKRVLLILMLVGCFWSCDNGQKQPPVDLKAKKAQDNAICVKFRESQGLVVIPAKLNGVSIDMIFDSGCSGMQLSLHELQTLYKNGVFSEDDIIGTTFSQVADGSIVEDGVVVIRELEIGGEDGLILHNIRATVSLNENAPVLLGMDVISEVASVEIDNVHETINIRKK